MRMKLDNQGRVIQPGAELLPRIVAVPCRARKLSVDLRPGLSLLDAVAEALPGCQGAALDMAGGAFGPLHYVMPALPRSPEHAAFYSDIFSPPGETALEQARLTFGTRNGTPWLHCHGFWTEADGKLSGGHILPEQAMICAPIPVEAWVLDGAAFVTRPDSETNFSLLGPEAAPSTGGGEVDAVALRLRPGLDFAETLSGVVRTQGWRAARIVGGVGSLIGAMLADGTGLSPRPTEMFITASDIARERASIDMAMIDHLGTRCAGRLAAGNKVLMTMELVLIPLA
jgi:predicted DNA-binding protein with PD1-like motif